MTSRLRRCILPEGTVGNASRKYIRSWSLKLASLERKSSMSSLSEAILVIEIVIAAYMLWP